MHSNNSHLGLDTTQGVITLHSQGRSYQQIANQLMISKTSVFNILKRQRMGRMEPHIVNQTLWHNPNAKVTEEYIQMLENLIKEQNELTDQEIADELTKRTDITVSASSICHIRKKLNITIKRKTFLYESRDNVKNIHDAKVFCKVHHKKTGFRKLYSCMSTDESGFKSTIQRSMGKSKIQVSRQKNHFTMGICKVSGGSYRRNRSRALGRMQKHSSFKFNLILTISLDENKPVVAYNIDDRYYNSDMFTEFIFNRNNPPNMNFDLVDKASFHRSHVVHETMGITPLEAFEYNNVIPDWIPTGWPEYNPVEQAFGWIKQYCRSQAKLYHNGRGWNKNTLKMVVREAIGNISHKLVKGWYHNSYSYMYPNHVIPTYLRRY